MNGHAMSAEMAEQPGVLDRLLSRREEVVRAVRRLVPARPAGIVFMARGSSMNAAVFGRYVLELSVGCPTSLAAMSLTTMYEANTDYRGWLAIAVSQSGRTPDVREALCDARRHGARTVAVVNDPGSPLAYAADEVVDLAAGAEQAIPATKTFTASLLALALIGEALGHPPWTAAQLAIVPERITAVLADEAPVDAVARRLVSADHLVATARGPMFAVALETALKVRETTGIAAEAFAAADLQHGSIAAVAASCPVVAYASPRTARDVARVVELVRARGAAVWRVAPDRAADVTLPADIPDALLPIAGAVRGQQLARCTAARLGRDPDAPAGLMKVTLTR